MDTLGELVHFLPRTGRRTLFRAAGKAPCRDAQSAGVVVTDAATIVALLTQLGWRPRVKPEALVQTSHATLCGEAVMPRSLAGQRSEQKERLNTWACDFLLCIWVRSLRPQLYPLHRP